MARVSFSAQKDALPSYLKNALPGVCVVSVTDSSVADSMTIVNSNAVQTSHVFIIRKDCFQRATTEMKASNRSSFPCLGY